MLEQEDIKPPVLPIIYKGKVIHTMGQILGRYYSPIFMKREGQDKLLIIKAFTIIDPVTGLFEIVQFNDKQASIISNLVEQAWLCLYPRPTIISYDRGNEFLGHLFKKKHQK